MMSFHTHQVLADEIHRAHQKCLNSDSCRVDDHEEELVLEAIERVMQQVSRGWVCTSKNASR